jgi:hypothetical protein
LILSLRIERVAKGLYSRDDNTAAVIPYVEDRLFNFKRPKNYLLHKTYI